MPKRANPDIRWYPDHDVPVCKEVLDLFRDEMIAECIANPEGVSLPLELGHIRLIGLKFQPKRSVSGVPLANVNTNGVVYTLKWFSTIKAVKVGSKDIPSFRESMWYTPYCLAKGRRAVHKMVLSGDWHRYAIKQDRGDFPHGNHDYLKRRYRVKKRHFSK